MKAPPRRIGNIELLAIGVWPLRNVRAHWDDSPTRPIATDLAHFIEARWAEARLRADQRGQSLFDCNLIGLQHLAPHCASLTIYTQASSYKGYVGTNRSLPRLIATFGHNATLANPLALCVCLRSLDGFLLLGQRSLATYDHPGYFHVPGGHMEIAKHLHGHRVNLQQALCDELREELAVSARLVTDIVCTGVIADAQSRKPELLLAANLRHLHGCIRLPANEEHGRLIWVHDSARALATFVRRYHRQLVPAGKACLLLYGRKRYGHAWFASMARILSCT